MPEPTKTVKGYFGRDKQITRDDYIARWAAHASELTCLAGTANEYEAAQVIVNMVKVQAGKAWDRIPG